MRRMRSGGTGAPPAAMAANASGGTCPSWGDSSSWRRIIGTTAVLVMRSLARISTASSTSHLYIVTSFEPIAVDTYSPVSPPMWKNGNTWSEAGCGASSLDGPAMVRATAPRNSVFMMFVQWLRCVASAPFGSPVVPDVYMIVAGSSGATSTSGSAVDPDRRVPCGAVPRPRRPPGLTAEPARDHAVDGEVAEPVASRSSRSPSTINTRLPESRIA